MVFGQKCKHTLVLPHTDWRQWHICKQECLLWSRRNTCITKSERKFEDQMDIHVFIYESKQNVIDSEKRKDFVSVVGAG